MWDREEEKKEREREIYRVRNLEKDLVVQDKEISFGEMLLEIGDMKERFNSNANA